MIYDVSIPITNTMPVWPSGPRVRLAPQPHLSRDGAYTINETLIEIGTHIGTHIDAPYHFIATGNRVHEIPLEQLIGKATVFEIPSVRSIGIQDLKNFTWDGIERALFKTENSKHWQDGTFYEDFVYLEPDAAEFLVEHGIKLVGIDYLSIDEFRSEKHPTHFVLLGKNIVILEGLNLNRVKPGEYTLF